jgi:glycosyltransferase involved in cell wall biosynthesis
LYESTYPEIKHKIVVQSYFVPTLKPPAKRSTEGRLSVLVAGNLSFHKGGDDIVSVIGGTEPDDVAFHVCGQAILPYDEQLKALAANRGGITLHGSYMPGEVPVAFFQCDVALFLSLWPETYLIALDEAMSAGCVPIVTNVGAPADRVIPGANGFKVDVGNVDHVVEILGELSKNRDCLNRLRDACMAVAPPSENEVASRVHGMTDWTSPPRSVSDQSPTRHLSSGDLGVGPKIAWISGVGSVAESHPSALVQQKQLHRTRYHLQKFVYTLRHDGIATALRKTGAHFHRFIF